MTLDAVHFEAMTDLINRVNRPGRARDRRALAERLWEEGLIDPPHKVPLEPIDTPKRHAMSIESLAVRDGEFERITAIDAGSLNPTTFQNGLVVDVAHAAVASTPSDIDLHRQRTIVAAVHGPPAEVRSTDEWIEFDHGYGRARLLAAPSLKHEEETAVHGLSLAAAEVSHALSFGVEHGDLLLMDGSVYPASILHWADREGTLAQRLHVDPEPRAVLEDAIALIDRCRERSTPIVGVVKNWTARGIVRGLNEADDLEVGTVPWPTDASLFQQLLANIADERTELRWTSWFAMTATVGTGLGYVIEEYDLAASEAASAYDLAMMVVYDPRENLVFRIEAPRFLIEEDSTREQITWHILSGIAREGGPPPTLRKADELARIGRGERRILKRELASALTSTEVPRYDDIRWGSVEAD